MQERIFLGNLSWVLEEALTEWVTGKVGLKISKIMNDYCSDFLILW